MIQSKFSTKENKEKREKKQYRTQDLAKRWDVSGETVRRYLKRFGNVKDEKGTFVLNYEQLEPLEKSLDVPIYKAAIKSNKWEIKPLNGDCYLIKWVKLNNHKLVFILQDVIKKKLWEATFFNNNIETAQKWLSKVIGKKNIYIKGCKNATSNRVVVNKIYFKKPY